MVSKRDKDAENGLQILSILIIIWAIGFFYFTRNGDFAGMDMGQYSIPCCNIIHFILIVILLSSWRVTARENKVKDYLTKHFESNSSVSLKHLIEKFNLSNTAAYKALSVWVIESGIKGTMDPISGSFIREPVEIESSEVLDVEFEEIPEELPFCPNCGKKMDEELEDGTPYCEECGTSPISDE